MKTNLVQFFFILLCIVIASALQDLWPTFGGVKPPVLLATVLHWAYSRSADVEPGRRREGRTHHLIECWLPAAAVAGFAEEALSNFPNGCIIGFFLLAGLAVRLQCEYLNTMHPAVAGGIVVTVAASIHELWLTVWGVVGDDPAPFIRFFSASLPAAVTGALVFACLPRLERAVGFDGPDTTEGRFA